MSFETCFISRLTETQPRSIEVICRYDIKGAGSKAKVLPSSQSLGPFTFPLGPQHVNPKEYMAPEVDRSPATPFIGPHPVASQACRIVILHFLEIKR